MLPGITMGLQAAGSVFGMIGQSKRRKAMKKYAAEVKQAAIEDAISQFAQMGKVSRQLGEQGAQQIQNIMRQSAMTQGAFRAGAGAAGVAGSSVEAVAQDFMKQQLTNIVAAESDLEVRQGNVELQKASIAAQASNRINQAYSQIPAKQNVLGSLFQIGANALTTYQTLK